MKPPTRNLLLSCLIAAMSGCSTIGGSDYAEKSLVPLTNIEAWRQEQTDALSTAYLTDLFSSKGIQSLVQQGLKKNPGLQQTTLAIRIAQESIVNLTGDRLPQAALNLTQSKVEDSDSIYQSDLRVSWTLDWLQKQMDNVQAGEATLSKRIAADQYARDLLSSSIMSTWLKLVQQNQLIEIEENRLRVLEQNEKTIVERYRKGLDELTDLDSAQSQSASSRATLSAYTEEYEVLQRAMALLLGETEYEVSGLASFPEVHVPLASIPSQDLGRRPDLQQAFLDIKVADLNSTVAYKSLLPSLSLSLSLSQSSTAFSDSLFTSSAWTLLNQLTAPLFQGGKLRAQARIADLTAEQSYWAYQERLLAAVKEVEDAIGQEKALSEQQAHIEIALENAQRSFEIYQTKYRQGLVTFLDLLTVQTQTFDLQVRKTQLTYNRLSNRISLGLALGLGVKS